MTAQDDIHGADGAGHRFAAMGPVLLCHDGSHHADRAVRRAATLLRPRDAVVLGLRRGPSGVGGGESGRRLALDAGFEPVAVASAGHGPMAEAVLEQAHRHDVSAIVLGSEGGASSPSRVLGGLPAALVDRSDLPVLVVPPGMPSFAASEPILMCYDGSPPARRALTTAAGLLMGRAAIVVAFMPAVDDVAILRSALPSPVAGAVQDGLARLQREEAEAPAERALEGARTAAAAGFLPRAAGIRGIDASSDEASDPFKRLLRTAATEDAACIVVGHRRSATRLESTAHSLVHHADRPVLVIPGAPSRAPRGS